MKINKEGLLKITNHYGINQQQRKLNEECYELIETIINYKYVELYKGSPTEIFHKQHIIEEISDVLVILKQFQYYYEIQDDEIEEVMNFKIKRQLERIKIEENKQ